MLDGIKQAIGERGRKALAKVASQRIEYEAFEPPRPPATSAPAVDAQRDTALPQPWPPPRLDGLRIAAERTTLPLLQVGRYGAVVRTTRLASPTPDQLNNLGCAWAALAIAEDRPDYRSRALAAFEQSRDGAQSKSERQRALDNIALIKETC